MLIVRLGDNKSYIGEKITNGYSIVIPLDEFIDLKIFRDTYKIPDDIPKSVIYDLRESCEAKNLIVKPVEIFINSKDAYIDNNVIMIKENAIVASKEIRNIKGISKLKLNLNIFIQMNIIITNKKYNERNWILMEDILSKINYVYDTFDEYEIGDVFFNKYKLLNINDIDINKIKIENNCLLKNYFEEKVKRNPTIEKGYYNFNEFLNNEKIIDALDKYYSSEFDLAYSRIVSENFFLFYNIINNFCLNNEEYIIFTKIINDECIRTIFGNEVISFAKLRKLYSSIQHINIDNYRYKCELLYNYDFKVKFFENALNNINFKNVEKIYKTLYYSSKLESQLNKDLYDFDFEDYSNLLIQMNVNEAGILSQNKSYINSYLTYCESQGVIKNEKLKIIKSIKLIDIMNNDEIKPSSKFYKTLDDLIVSFRYQQKSISNKDDENIFMLEVLTLINSMSFDTEDNAINLTIGEVHEKIYNLCSFNYRNKKSFFFEKLYILLKRLVEEYLINNYVEIDEIDISNVPFELRNKTILVTTKIKHKYKLLEKVIYSLNESNTLSYNVSIDIFHKVSLRTNLIFLKLKEICDQGYININGINSYLEICDTINSPNANIRGKELARCNASSFAINFISNMY